ncbi:TRAF-type zinc finger-containing protein [Reticulomyxa filosa]|uniref:TRAF-type zinc finger-containing protein n=1 Tax=Reticulomyxa filosa TaxID=46433 RepID=X6NIF7_RETFI|nr:TRAF-type zinc finger-containing protein [Reticulomyxa filosa]|eukprot:ETO25137.1 TRAF-type zinc finger-containing protein [Reticulomyxa filosa]
MCRKDFENHKAKCAKSCRHCKVVLDDETARAAHVEQCARKQTCRLCLGKVDEEELSHHMESSCPDRLVKCPYYEFGCVESVKYQHLSQHLKYNAVTHNTMKIDDTSAKVEALQSQNKKFRKVYIELTSHYETLQKAVESMIYSNKEINEDMKKEISDLRKTISQNHVSLSPIPDVLLLVGSNKWEESGIFIKRWKLHQDLEAWLIDRRGLAFDNEASLIAYQDVAHPGLVTTNWLVYNGDTQQWLTAEKYRIECFTMLEFMTRPEELMGACDPTPMAHVDMNKSQQTLNSKSVSRGDAVRKKQYSNEMLPTYINQSIFINSNFPHHANSPSASDKNTSLQLLSRLNCNSPDKNDSKSYDLQSAGN